MVAWVPIPFAQLSDISDPRHEEDFLLSDHEKVNLASIHTLLMQLSEVFLAYNSATSSEIEYPRVIMMDMSPSSVLASVAIPASKVGLVGYPYDRRRLDEMDVIIATAHPFNERLGLPTTKNFTRSRAVIAALAKCGKKPIRGDEICTSIAISPSELHAELEHLRKAGIIKMDSGSIEPAVDINSSWEFTLALFQRICSNLFIKKEPTALQYTAKDPDGTERRRWMAPDDIKFLIGVGLRALIEKCWERKIVLYGIVKDSESRYLSRNYLGVCQEAGYYPELNTLKIPPLPWTDRIFLENLPLTDETLFAPWSTIEFDSAFMTLHREKDHAGATKVAGVMGRIVNQERLFMRSLAQFFLKREKATPMMGHVVFIDRLIFPELDLPEENPLAITTPELGTVRPLAFKDKDHGNMGQMLMMYLLSVLTKNHFPEVLGYPDPLHKADWGAKTIGRRVAAAIESSTISFKSKPISKTFRSIRDSARR